MGGARRRRDYEVVSATRLSCTPCGNEQLSVRLGDGGVVIEHRDVGRDLLHERLPLGAVAFVAQRDTHEQFGERYGCDRHVVVVVDRLVERSTGAVCGDKESCVQ